mgnify:CR=1 FL=1
MGYGLKPVSVAALEMRTVIVESPPSTMGMVTKVVTVTGIAAPSTTETEQKTERWATVQVMGAGATSMVSAEVREIAKALVIVATRHRRGMALIISMVTDGATNEGSVTETRTDPWA